MNRLTRVTLLVAALAVAAPAAASPLSGVGISAGFSRASANVAIDGGMMALDLGSRFGHSFGIETEWFRSDHFSAVVGLKYVERSSVGSWESLVPEFPGYTGPRIEPAVYRDTRLVSRVGYVSVPIVGTFRVPIGSASAYVVAGPRIDLHVRGEVQAGDWPTGFRVVGPAGEVSADADPASIVYGFDVGAGVEYSLTARWSAHIEGCYCHDFNSALLFEDFGLGDLGSDSRAVQIQGGLMYRL